MMVLNYVHFRYRYVDDISLIVLKRHHFLAMFICLHHKGIEITWYCMSTAHLTIYVHKTDDVTLCNPAWLISTIGISFGE